MEEEEKKKMIILIFTSLDSKLEDKRFCTE
jgi:hypothetical protein